MNMEFKMSKKFEELFDRHKKRVIANRLVAFSSQYGKEFGEAYTAVNIAKGELMIYPRYGDFKEAFVLRTYGQWWKMSNLNIRSGRNSLKGFISKDFVEFLIPEKLFIEEIEIYETYNPGAVVSIYAFDYSKDKWMQMWSIFDDGAFKNEREAINRELPPKRSQKFCPSIRQKDIFTDLIRLEFADFCHDYYTELDGVALVGYDASHKPKSKEVVRREHVVERLVSVEEKEKNIFDLPSELINMIVSQLDLVTFFQLRSTCKFFHKVCSNEAWFYELNLQPYWMLANDYLVDSIRSLCKPVELMNLSWTKNLSSDPLMGLFQTVSATLKVLSLACCQYVNDDMLQFICTNCVNITELDLHSCENLRAFHPISNLNKLKKLNLYRTLINTDDATCIIALCSSLENINMGSCTQIENIESVLAQIYISRRNLKGIELWRCNNLGSGLLSIAEACPDLEELDIGWCKTSFSDLQILIKLCTKLKKLFLTAVRITDNELNCVSQHLSNLELFDILGSYHVSRVAVDQVFEKCKNLKFFDISFCTAVTTVTDAVQELRRLHTNCEIKASYQE